MVMPAPAPRLTRPSYIQDYASRPRPKLGYTLLIDAKMPFNQEIKGLSDVTESVLKLEIK